MKPSQKLSKREAGKLGGKAGKGKSKARDPQKMREAAMKRWHGATISEATNIHTVTDLNA